VRRLTSTGPINQTPTYHTNSGFTADGRHLVLVSVREGATWVLAAEVATGELQALWRAPGIGDRSYIHRGMSLAGGEALASEVDGGGICGNRVCLAPRSRTAVIAVGRSLVAVAIDTGAARVLLEDCGDEWIFGAPCVDPAERWVAVALSTGHPELVGHPQLAASAARAGGRERAERITLGDVTASLVPARDYCEHEHRLRLVRVPLDGAGGVEVLYEHPGPAQSAHCAFCPADGNLLYFDLDLPPRYWCGGDGLTPRIWLLDLATGAARPVKAQYPGPFQIHQAWLWDGRALAYHGRASEGGEYFGLVTPAGETLWERTWPEATAYGHLAADATRPALIIDGQFGDDRLQWLYWDTDEPHGAPVDSPAAAPRLETICRHGTEWGSIPGQYSHPHPLTDGAGNWISFTAARGGRSDVYVVDVRS